MDYWELVDDLGFKSTYLSALSSGDLKDDWERDSSESSRRARRWHHENFLGPSILASRSKVRVGVETLRYSQFKQLVHEAPDKTLGKRVRFWKIGLWLIILKKGYMLTIIRRIKGVACQWQVFYTWRPSRFLFSCPHVHKKSQKKKSWSIN